MRIAIVGIRGIPSTYSGFETFIENLAPRLAAKGHTVEVYCRSSLFKERPDSYRGVFLRYLPSLEHKMLSTLTHSFVSIIDACFRKNDIIFAVNAANGLFGFIPRVFGRKCIINVDGMEWLRPKWSSFGRWFFRNSAKLGTWFYDEVVTDAEEMHRLYAKQFRIDSVYIAYGASVETSENPEIIEEYGLKPGNYYLVASRLVPDNNADVIVEGFVRSGTRKYLAIAGGADYVGNSVEKKFIEKIKGIANERVLFLGHISKPNHVKELHCNCYAYIHGHEFGGINPALLKALGYSNLVLANDTPFSNEVLESGKYGVLFQKDPLDLARKIVQVEQNPDQCQRLRKLAPKRIIERFTWDRIAGEYEELFQQLLK